MADTAAQAWGHCLAVLRDPKAAETAAMTALRRGGRPRTAVLAHARAEALAGAATAPPPAPGDEALADDLDVVGLALLLAASREPVERSIVDLEGRLDRARLARALGLPPVETATRAAEIGTAWERQLDPALLAWLGPGECQGLAEVLAAAGLGAAPGPPPAVGQVGPAEDSGGAGPAEAALRPPITVGALLANAPTVATHVDGCEVCSDRRRAMASVRALQAQAPVPPVPRVLRAARTTGLLRMPAPWPPPLDGVPEPSPSGPRQRVIAGAAIVVLLAGAGAVAAWRHDRVTRNSSVAALAALPGSGNALTVTPALVPANGVVVLSDVSGHRLSWQATPSAPWVVISPTTGTLEPRERIELQVRLLPTAPPGGARAFVGITGSDGSAAQVDVAGPSTGPLDVAATINGCVVHAHVVDSVDALPVLHYRQTGTNSPALVLPMQAGTAGYVATLPETGQPLTWWVTATDSRGGAARTPDQVTFLQDCPPAA